METANADGTQAALPLQTCEPITSEMLLKVADMLALLRAQEQDQLLCKLFTDYFHRLIAAAGDVDIKDPSGYTALQLAASRQLPGAVKVLLARGASVSRPFGGKGENLLLEAATGYGLGGWLRGHPELDLQTAAPGTSGCSSWVPGCCERTRPDSPGRAGRRWLQRQAPLPGTCLLPAPMQRQLEMQPTAR